MVRITRAEEEEILCKFVADIPIKLSWRTPPSSSCSWVFWSQEEEEEAISQLTSSSTSSVLAIRNHIKTALCYLNCFRSVDNVLVQFWAPTTTTIGRLTTSNEPFALHRMNEDLVRYRKHCHSYECGVGDGIPARAFRNQVNEYSQDVSYYSIDEYPQRDLALSCGINKIMAVPIFQHHSCVGVLELLCYDDIFPFFNSFRRSFEWAGLNVIHPKKIRKEQLPKQGADHVEKEISNALQHACEKCGLPSACAWVRCVHSTLMGHCGNLSCAGELVVSMPCMMPSYHSHMYGSLRYYGAASDQAMRVGHGLLGNAFLSHKPFLCRDVTQLGMSEYPMAHTARKIGLTTCFAIGLQSIATGNRDYVLEFFLPLGTTHSRSDLHGLLFSILAILKRYLKSFVAVTGDPEDEIFIEVDKSSVNTVFESLKTCPNIVTHIESGALKNEGEVVQADFSGPQLVMEELVTKGSDFVGLQQSQVACLLKEKHLAKKSKAQDQNKESSCSYETLEQHFGRKLEDVAESLGVSRSTVKRWCRDNNIRRWPFPKRSKVCSGQPIPKQINAPIQENAVPISESSAKDPSSSDLPTNLDPTQAATNMMVKATYREDIIKFQLCSSSRMRDLVDKVILRLKLSEGTFKIRYQDDDGDYILIACDDDLQVCMNSLKSLKETTIKMLIEPITYTTP